ncbi:MAG: hypothetical protein ACREN2_09540 [Candidatus Dormibacteria bacterium]
MSEETLAVAEWDPFAAQPVRTSVQWRWGTLRVGDTVRLTPRGGADVIDIALRGRLAAVESIEMDYEDRIHVAVVVDDDPGREFGLMRQPGHRFFFSVDDIEPPTRAEASDG